MTHGKEIRFSFLLSVLLASLLCAQPTHVHIHFCKKHLKLCCPHSLLCTQKLKPLALIFPASHTSPLLFFQRWLQLKTSGLKGCIREVHCLQSPITELYEGFQDTTIYLIACVIKRIKLLKEDEKKKQEGGVTITVFGVP